MNRRPKSNIRLLEKQFASIILNVRDGDSTGRPSSMAAQRYTFTLIDGSKFYINERISNDVIVMSYYDWVKSSGETILKFHSEAHDGDMRYQTSTEPHHIHPPEFGKVHNMTRYPNFHHQELPQIFEHIFLTFVASGHI